MITNQEFWLLIILPLIVIFFISLLIFKLSDNEKKLQKINKNSGWINFTSILLIILLIIGNILFFPKVYDVKNCGDFNVKTLIIPQKINNQKLSYNSGLIVINRSKKVLIIKAHNYGSQKNKNEMIIKILPENITKINAKDINFFFHKAPTSYLFKKYEATTKYSINCENEVSELSFSNDSNSESKQPTGTIFWNIVFYCLGGAFTIVILLSLYFKIVEIINKNKSHY